MNAFTLRIPTVARVILLCPVLIVGLALRATLDISFVPWLAWFPLLLGVAVLWAWMHSGSVTLTYDPTNNLLTYSTGRWFRYAWCVPCRAVVAYHIYTIPVPHLSCQVVVLQIAGHSFVLPPLSTTELPSLWTVLS